MATDKELAEAEKLERKRAYKREYAAKNAEKIRAYAAAYREANREKLREYHRKPERKARKNELRRARGTVKTEARLAYEAAYFSKQSYRDRARQRAKEYAANPENAAKINALKVAYRRSEAGREKILINRHARRSKVGGRLSKNIVATLLTSQRGLCAGCGLPLAGSFHLDHILPIALGGTNSDDNVQLLHPKCNAKKGAKHPAVWAQEIARNA